MRLARAAGDLRPVASLWSLIAPALCAVHCLAAPVITVVAPALVDAPALEWAFYAMSATAVAIALPAGARRHGQRRFVALAGAALLVWVIALANLLDGVSAEAVIAAASLTTAAALLGNLRRLRLSAADAHACVACGSEHRV